MSPPAGPAVRRADGTDAEAIGRLLHDFNREFDEPTPDPDALAARVRWLLAARRHGCRVVLRRASSDLRELVAAMGLSDVLLR